MEFKRIIEGHIEALGYSATTEEVEIIAQGYKEFHKEVTGGGDEEALEALAHFGDIEEMMRDAVTFEAILFDLVQEGKIEIDEEVELW